MAAARNPKGDKSGRGLRSRPTTALLVDLLGCTPEPGSELWLLDTANRRETDPRTNRRLWRRGACLGAYWGLLGLKTA